MGYYIIIFELIIGFLSGLKAREKQRNPYFWFFIGFIFSVLGLFIILLLPSKEINQERIFEDEE